jgi:signal transduction histidine kinase/putative methionine-R-sulfoxide reductase with GAF domain
MLPPADPPTGDIAREIHERRNAGRQERRREGLQERERAIRLQLLADVGRRTAAILSRGELLRTSVRIIQETFHYFMVNIFLVDGGDIVLRACTMPEFDSRIGRLRMRVGREGINGWVAGTGEPLNVPDVRVDARYRLELSAERAVRSELSVPILLKGAVIGVLDAQSQAEAAFNDLDVFTLQTVAGQLAVSLENARLYEEVERELAMRRRTEKLLRALHAAGLSMQRAASPEEVFVRVGEELGKVGLLCALHLAVEDPSRVTLAYASPGIAPDRASADAVSPAESKVLQSLKGGAQAVYEKGGIVAPLLFEDRRLGFLTVLSPELGIDDIPAIQVFANEIAASWSKARLVRELRESLQELQRMQEQLIQSQKMEAVGRLAGGVAHDFNNQLTAIMGYAEVILSTLGRDDPQRRDVNEILRAARRAAELTSQLLAFSRRQVLRPRIVDLNVLVGEMRGMLQRLIGENIQLRTRFAEGPLRVRADPAQLEQVVMNLAVNARDAMPEGGTLEISTEIEPPGRSEDGAGYLLLVQDTGTGMSPEVVSRLFEPFFTTKDPGRGTGLGLSTAYGIIKQSGGSITCHTALGSGTTFLIRLPATTEKQPDDAPESQPEAAAGTEKILLVEDEDQVRDLISRILVGAGYTVVSAASGDEGCGILAGGDQVQMVITDLVLPGTASGLDVARRVLADSRAIGLLCISGYSQQIMTGPKGLPVPAPFLQKPFSASQLLKKVRSIMDGVPEA